ncbi:MAG TPA: hypothetical protein VGM19_12510 [Armatimonadota bacterium]|jgi:hypothetical protein
MKRLTLTLSLALLVVVAGTVLADTPTWQPPFTDSFMFQWTRDPAAVGSPVMSPTYMIRSAIPTQAPANYSLRVSLNGKPTELGGDFLRAGGAYLLPADSLKVLGLGVSYSEDNMTITVSGKGHTLTSTLYAPRATVDGFSQPARAASRWARGLRYISLDLVAQAFNLVVTEEAGQVRISAY